MNKTCTFPNQGGWLVDLEAFKPIYSALLFRSKLPMSKEFLSTFSKVYEIYIENFTENRIDTKYSPCCVDKVKVRMERKNI